MVTLFLRQGENGKQVLLSFPATTPAEKADVAATMESLKSMSKTITIQGAASEVMNLGLYLSGVDLAAEGEVERIDQLAKRLEHMSEVDCDKFAGMLDANSISGTKDILQLTEHLDDYVILPGCSSAQSIGKYLMEACIECAREAGYLQLELEVVAGNERAVEMYKRAGFIEYGRNPKAFRLRTGEYQELIDMRLELK